jgi:hypothetical protein
VLVGKHGFRFYFTPLPGCFSPFPHGTCSLSVDEEYLGLADGPAGFPPDYTCPAVLRYLLRSSSLRYGAVTLYGRPFQVCSLATRMPYRRPYNPRSITTSGFGLFPVRSPLLGESLSCLLFLRVLRCFTSPGSLPDAYEFSIGYQPSLTGGLPHSEI